MRLLVQSLAIYYQAINQSAYFGRLLHDNKKAKVKKSDYHTNIDKHRVAANITEYHVLSN